MSDTTDPPLDPAEMCEMVGRLIFRGVPAPINVTLYRDRPQVLVMPDVLDYWLAVTAADAGTWEVLSDPDVEHYRAHADGFDIVSNRPYVGRHAAATS